MLFIQPVKHVPCTRIMGAGTSCGTITVSKEQAEGYIVNVGWKRFEEIVYAKQNPPPTEAEKLKLLADFAKSEVVSQGYCSSAIIPPDKYYIMGWEGSNNHAIYVTCEQ